MLTPEFLKAPTDINTEQPLYGESDLDFELVYPIIYPQTITLYQTDDAFYATSGIGAFNTFLDGIDGVKYSQISSQNSGSSFGTSLNAPIGLFGENGNDRGFLTNLCPDSLH